MDPKNGHISEDLIARYLAGETSQAENREVLDWSKEPENQQQLYEYQAVWEDLGVIPKIEHLDIPREFDTESALQKVRERKAQQLDAQSSSIPWLRIAAGLVVALGLGWWMYSINQTEDLQMMAVNEAAEYELEDGSQITLNQNSSLTYPEHFASESRKVKMTGEAFFEVEHKPEQPFEVEVAAANIRVLGTSFNVNDISHDSTVVFVQTGRVLFFNDQNEVILTEGMTGVLNKSTGLITSRKNMLVVGKDTFWKTKTLNFEGNTLASVVETVNEMYGTNIVLGNPTLSGCRITVTFIDEDLEDILTIISLTLGLEVTRANGEIVINGSGC